VPSDAAVFNALTGKASTGDVAAVAAQVDDIDQDLYSQYIDALIVENSIGNSTNSMLFVLEGQSNVEANSHEYPPYPELGVIDNVYMITFQSDAYISVIRDWSAETIAWGPELEMFQRMHEMFPDRTIYIMKNGDGGTDIDTWLPESSTIRTTSSEYGEMNNHAFCTNGVNWAIENFGCDFHGVFFFQGQTQSHVYTNQSLYADAERVIRSSYRDAFGSNLLWVTVGTPSYDGKLAERTYPNYAKMSLAAEDPLTRYVDIFDLPSSYLDVAGNYTTNNLAHLSGDGLVQAGDLMVEAMFANSKSIARPDVSVRTLQASRGITIANGDITIAGESLTNTLNDIETLAYRPRANQNDLLYAFDMERPDAPDLWGTEVIGGTGTNIEWIVDDTMGGAFDLNGSSDYIEHTVTTTDTFTYAVYAQLGVSSSITRGVFENNSNSGWWLRIYGNSVRLYADGGYVINGGAVVVGSVPYVIIVRRTTTGSDGIWTINTYRSDTAVSTQNVYTNLMESMSLSTTLKVGLQGTTAFADGPIADSYGWKRVLSDEEVDAVVKAFINRYPAIYGSK
jgi:hypothetical protein